MPKHCNKKKASTDETPYQSVRGKKDGPHDGKSTWETKKTTSNNKTKKCLPTSVAKTNDMKPYKYKYKTQ
jgi:hypothetical protein